MGDFLIVYVFCTKWETRSPAQGYCVGLGWGGDTGGGGLRGKRGKFLSWILHM